MTEIQRYSMFVLAGDLECEVDKEGHWVRFSDYDQLKAENEVLTLRVMAGERQELAALKSAPQSAPAGYRMVPVDLLERAAESIESELDDRYGKPVHPALQKKYASDMVEVEEIRNLLAAPKADMQCPAYSERIVPASTALIQWAWEDEPESTLFDEGYNAARRWVKMQLEYAVSKAPQPVSDDVMDAARYRWIKANAVLGITSRQQVALTLPVFAPDSICGLDATIDGEMEGGNGDE